MWWSIRDQVKKSVLIDLTRVLVLSRVDYCNSFYYGLPNFLSAKLCQIMYSAARLIFRLSPSTPTTSPCLKQLHWLPIGQRIVFKTLLYAHCFVHQPGKLPLYLSKLNETRWLQGPNIFTIYLFPSFTPGRHSFSHAVAVEWNKLSFKLKFIPSEILFRQKLKSF